MVSSVERDPDELVAPGDVRMRVVEELIQGVPIGAESSPVLCMSVSDVSIYVRLADSYCVLCRYQLAFS